MCCNVFLARCLQCCACAEKVAISDDRVLKCFFGSSIYSDMYRSEKNCADERR